MRLQVMPLPTSETDDEPRWMLVVDQAEGDGEALKCFAWKRLKSRTGACAVLVYPGTVEVA